MIKSRTCVIALTSIVVHAFRHQDHVVAQKDEAWKIVVVRNPCSNFKPQYIKFIMLCGQLPSLYRRIEYKFWVIVKSVLGIVDKRIFTYSSSIVEQQAASQSRVACLRFLRI